jgi:signal transduction histidine kinase
MDRRTLKDARILIVDDEVANVRVMERLLARGGYTTLRSTTDSRQVSSLYTEFQPDLILLDLVMPEPNGFQLMEALKPLGADGSYRPILALTADVTQETRRRALAAGAKDFLTKPFDATEVFLRIENLLQTRFLYLELQARNERLETEVRERTQQLVQSEKVATMGSLLAGVAHELNNPLSVVLGRVVLLSRKLAGSPLLADVEKLGRAAERCGRIVKNFLALARQRPPERAQVQLNLVVQEAVELVAYPLRVDSVDVRLDLADPLPPVWADPHQLQQVVVNLLTNAHHAMRQTRPRQVIVTTRHEPVRGSVSLRVADSGPGIPPELQARIFEPFFTTKPAGEGTGLGLAICRGILDSHGGSIRVESAPGQGAAFVIDVPVESRRETRPEAVSASTEALIQGKTILVVDDEPEVAEVLRELLSQDGHSVDIAPDGAVALEKIHARAYDAILSDNRMPGLDGPGLYRELERRHPELLPRMILVTGDTLTLSTEEFLERTRVPTLYKPFDAAGVRRVVQRVLGAAGPKERVE